jgi:hypothetical protein
MRGELNARNALLPPGTRSARNALPAGYYLLSYSILYYISVPVVVEVWKL